MPDGHNNLSVDPEHEYNDDTPEYKSPFEGLHAAYINLGFHVLAIGHGRKIPCFLKDGVWQPAAWKRHAIKPASAAEIRAWARWRDAEGNGAGIGLAMGTPAGVHEGQPCIVVALDFDPANDCSNEAAIMSAMVTSIPTAWGKIGNRGGTMLVRMLAADMPEGFDFRGPGGALQAIRDGQIVVPNTVHPTTNAPYYRWPGTASLSNATALPVVLLADLVALMGRFSYQRSAGGSKITDAAMREVETDLALAETRPGLIAELDAHDPASLLGDLWHHGADAEVFTTGTGKGGTRDQSGSARRLALAKTMLAAGYNVGEFCEATIEWSHAEGAKAFGERDLLRAWAAALGVAKMASGATLGGAAFGDVSGEEGATGPKGKLRIKMSGGDLDRVATAAEQAIISAGLPMFQRGNALVMPVAQQVPASDGREITVAGFMRLSIDALRDKLCEAGEFLRFNARSKGWIAIDPPRDVAAVLLARVGQWNVPVIAGLITAPTLRPNGTLLDKPGFDAQTRLYHVVDIGLVIRPGVHNPTREEAERALADLRDLMSGFPFDDADGQPGVSEAVALAGIITVVVRGAMDVAPLIAVRAHTPGTGKSLLVDLASLIATGQRCPVTSAAPNIEETEKRLAGLLLAGYPIVSLDNVNGPIGGDLLCQATERPRISIRRLGGSDMTDIEARATLFCTGNNLRIAGDMTRRALLCDLDAKEERPELRTFKTDPVAMVLADRGRYVSAALTICRAYVAAGCPAVVPALGSYGGWSRMVRAPLVWLGCADPAASMERARGDDPELSDVADVIEGWVSAIGDGVTLSVRDLIERTEAINPETGEKLHRDFRDALRKVALGVKGEINPSRLGRWLASKKGRIVNGKRIVQATTLAHGGGSAWKVEILQ